MTASLTKAIFNVSLTTSPVKVALPDGVSATGCLIVATSGDTPVAWRRQEAIDSSVSILYPDSHIGRMFKLQPGATMFYAKTVIGTATLEIEALE